MLTEVATREIYCVTPTEGNSFMCQFGCLNQLFTSHFHLCCHYKDAHLFLDEECGKKYGFNRELIDFILTCNEDYKLMNAVNFDHFESMMGLIGQYPV